MAITFEEGNVSKTNLLQIPAWRDIYIKLSSDDANIVNILLNIRKTGVDWLQLVKPVDFGTTDEFTFRIHKLIQSELGSSKLYWDTPLTAPAVALASYEVFDIEDSKEQVLSSGLLVDGDTITTGESTTFIAQYSNRVFELHPYETETGDPDLYFGNAQALQLFLTTRTEQEAHKNFLIRRQALQWVYNFGGGMTSTPLALQVKTYNGNTLLNTYNISISPTSGRNEIPIGLDYLIGEEAGIGTDLPDATKFTVQIKNSGLTINHSNIITVNLLDDCSYFAIHYVNRLGAFDVKYVASPPIYNAEIEQNFFDGVEYDSDDYTRVKTKMVYQSARHYIDIVTKRAKNDIMKDWFAIATSPEIYLQFKNSTELIRYYTDPADFKGQDKQTRDNSIGLRFYSSEMNTLLK